MQKKKSGVKKCLEILPLRGGGGRTPNGKCHLKFPFLFFAPLPYALPYLIGYTPSICNPEKGLKKVLWNQKIQFITDFFLGKWGIYPSPFSENFVCLKILLKLSDITYRDQSVLGRGKNDSFFVRNLS